MKSIHSISLCLGDITLDFLVMFVLVLNDRYTIAVCKPAICKGFEIGVHKQLMPSW